MTLLGVFVVIFPIINITLLYLFIKYKKIAIETFPIAINNNLNFYKS